LSDLAYVRDVKCEMERCRALLLDEAFLAAFVDLQHPIDPRIAVSLETRSSSLQWTVATEGIPAVFSRVIPKTVPVHLKITVPEGSGPPGAISVDLPAKPSGELRASFALSAKDDAPGRTALAVTGSFKINLGIVSGKAASYLKAELIIPILDELADLLEVWAERPPQ
jgi:hypothetical protein